MKNSEWGAVAYLAQSSYGINGKIYINNVNINGKINSTIYAITGYAGDGIDVEENLFSTAPILEDTISNGTLTSYAWNTINGQKGSSTGNLYGIYDLSGCVWERVSSYILNDGGVTNRTKHGGTLPQTVSDKLRTKYDHDTSDEPISSNSMFNNYSKNWGRYGDAMYETSNITSDSTTTESWYNDFSFFFQANSTFVNRGGCYTGSDTGLFAFGGGIGNGNSVNGGFRAVLSPL